MGKGKKITRSRNLVPGYRVIIRKHVIDRYIERTGVSREEAERTITTKFRNSKLDKIKKDGIEVRHEVSGAMSKRLTFLCKFERNTFVVITCFVQGSRHDWWKNKGLVKTHDICEEEQYHQLEKEQDFFEKAMSING